MGTFLEHICVLLYLTLERRVSWSTGRWLWIHLIFLLSQRSVPALKSLPAAPVLLTGVLSAAAYFHPLRLIFKSLVRQWKWKHHQLKASLAGYKHYRSSSNTDGSVQFLIHNSAETVTNADRTWWETDACNDERKWCHAAATDQHACCASHTINHIKTRTEPELKYILLKIEIY